MPKHAQPSSSSTAGGFPPRDMTAASATARFEEVPPATDASFGVFTYDRPTFERGWHYHPEAELTLIEESSGRRFVGDHIAAFDPGDLVLLGPNLPHTWRTEAVPIPNGGRARSIYVHFRAEWLEYIAKATPELLDIRKLLDMAARGLVFTGADRDAAAPMLRQLKECSGVRRLALFLEVLGRLAAAHNYHPLSSAGFSPHLDGPGCERIRKIHKYVYQSFRSGINHQELARLTGLSPAALSKFFRRTTGRTLTEFIHEVRIGEVSRLLIDTTHNISEIAYATGFDSLANFNTTFRRLKQVSPSRFREMHRKSQG